MEEIETLELYEVEFCDLITLSSENPTFSGAEEMERLQSIASKVIENLGPTGPGLLSIKGLPKAPILRRSLLPLARKLSLLHNQHQKRLLKEHGLGSDVPLKNLDRTVSSFAMQLKYVQDAQITCTESSHFGVDGQGAEQGYLDVERTRDLQDNEFKNLGDTFKELGFCMMELGLRLARICDRSIGGQELEQSLLASCTAKGRLIHYHSTLDNLILNEGAKSKGFCRGRSNSAGSETKNANQFDLWQQWHYDYGIFTVLTAPMFMLPCHPQTKEQECPSPSGHTYLQIFDPNKNTVLMVKASPESFIIQVGESADILSKGKLRSTLHSVCRPEKLENLSRETFVVFLQPAWSKTFSLLDYPIERSTSSDQNCGKFAEESHSVEQEVKRLTREIHKIVPPLSDRLKDGMTFAEFSRETTKQYYGGNGLQSEMRGKNKKFLSCRSKVDV